MGDVPFVNELETFVGNQFIAKHVAFFNPASNTTFYSNSIGIPVRSILSGGFTTDRGASRQTFDEAGVVAFYR